MSKEKCKGFEALFAQPLICGVFWSRNDKTLQCNLHMTAVITDDLLSIFSAAEVFDIQVLVNEYSLSL